MAQDKITRIKNAVKGNFDESSDIYQTFENKYGFFRRLNEKLLSKMNIPQGARILDVGCGTGVSSAHLLDAVPKCQVFGLDNSKAMLETARACIGESDRLRFIHGDAADLSSCFDIKFHAIIYSASIFLIPDYEVSLLQARDLLEAGGSVGLTFMDGLYTVDGKLALALADKEAGEDVSLRKPVDIASFHDFFRKTFSRERSWKEDMRLPIEELREFYSVPAMSAGLFPKIPYTERVEKVARLFDHLPNTVSFFRWVFMIGEVA
jgi:ubiquinone/menaquinone biosynthesis C-methylase UbiE